MQNLLLPFICHGSVSLYISLFQFQGCDGGEFLYCQPWSRFYPNMDGEQSSQVFWHNLASSCRDYLLTDCFWIGQLDCESEVSIFNFTKAQILCLDFSLNGKLINTSYLTDSYIVFTLKMESVSNNTIFGITIMVKTNLKVV